MRRVLGALCCTAFVACTQATDKPSPPPDVIASAAPSTAVPSVTPSPELTLEPTASCDGLGRAPLGGQITYVEEGRLMAASPDGGTVTCLADLADIASSPSSLLWNAPGDRILIGGRVLNRDLTATERLAPVPALWSRPTGTSVIWVDDGRLMKRPSGGGPAVDISFLARHDDVAYHPAGTHISTSGLAVDGNYGLYLATNLGEEEQLIARGEQARFITNLTFSEDGGLLYYTAKHGPEDWHLHRMRIGAEASLETLAKRDSDFVYVVSPDDPFQVAWFSSGDCAAGEHGTFRASYPKLEIPGELENSDLKPVGWLSHTKLLVTSSPVGCSTASPHDLYVLRRGAPPVLIIEEVGATAAIRRVADPPPPPPGEEQEVVA